VISSQLAKIRGLRKTMITLEQNEREVGYVSFCRGAFQVSFAQFTHIGFYENFKKSKVLFEKFMIAKL
jgi:hypothetical protein